MHCQAVRWQSEGFVLPRTNPSLFRASGGANKTAAVGNWSPKSPLISPNESEFTIQQNDPNLCSTRQRGWINGLCQMHSALRWPSVPHSRVRNPRERRYPFGGFTCSWCTNTSSALRSMANNLPNRQNRTSPIDDDHKSDSEHRTPHWG